MNKRGLTRLAAALLIAVVLPGAIPTEAIPPETLEECAVCGRTHDESLFAVEYKGRSLRLCSGECLEMFHRLLSTDRLDRITSDVEPRGALFHADSTVSPPLSRFFFFLGVYLLSGLLMGGLSAFIAIRRGRGSGSAFILGMALNAAGLDVVLLRPKPPTDSSPDGLTKAPATLSSVSCPGCNANVHPTARRCVLCGAELKPSLSSEVERARHRKK